ncbi:MAG: hypothetical protein ACFFC7_04190 [Candidatus Hermodarchaeota archaeon]
MRVINLLVLLLSVVTFILCPNFTLVEGTEPYNWIYSLDLAIEETNNNTLLLTIYPNLTILEEITVENMAFPLWLFRLKFENRSYIWSHVPPGMIYINYTFEPATYDQVFEVNITKFGWGVYYLEEISRFPPRENFEWTTIKIIITEGNPPEISVFDSKYPITGYYSSTTIEKSLLNFLDMLSLVLIVICLLTIRARKGSPSIKKNLQ